MLHPQSGLELKAADQTTAPWSHGQEHSWIAPQWKDSKNTGGFFVLVFLWFCLALGQPWCLFGWASGKWFGAALGPIETSHLIRTSE